MKKIAVLSLVVALGLTASCLTPLQSSCKFAAGYIPQLVTTPPAVQAPGAPAPQTSPNWGDLAIKLGGDAAMAFCNSDFVKALDQTVTRTMDDWISTFSQWVGGPAIRIFGTAEKAAKALKAAKKLPVR